MRVPLITTAIVTTMALAGCSTMGDRGSRYGYDRGPAYGARGDRPPRYLRDNDEIYRDRDGRYYCKRDDGTTGTIVGALAGGVLGNIIAPGGSKTLGTIIGGGAGAIAGRAIDKNDVRCE